MGLCRLIATMCVVFFVAACSSSVSDTTTISEPTIQPASLALVDDPESSEAGSNHNVVELTIPENLPEDLSDRLELMTSWLRQFEPAKNSGYDPFDILENGEVKAHFLVRTADVRVAEELCGIYVEAVDRFMGESETTATISLSGWVLSDVGVFADPGWDPISCEV